MNNLNIIFIHGWLFDSRIWRGLDKEFNEFKSVKLIDLPGYGTNKRSKVNHKDFCRKLFSSIEDRTIVVAWSYGALLALDACHEIIASDIKIVLINANLDIHDPNNRELSMKNIDELITNLRLDKNRTIKNFMYECVKHSNQSKQEFKEISSMFKMTDFPSSEILINNLNEMKLFSSNKHIPFKSDNILCINTDKDQFVDKKSIAYLEVIIKGLGHIPFIYGNKNLYKSIIDFL